MASLDELKKKLQGIIANANPLGDNDPSQLGRQNLWTNTANKAMVGLSKSPVGQGMVNAQRFIERPKPVNLIPEARIARGNDTFSRTANTLYNLPGKFVAEPLNWVANLGLDALANTGRTLGGQQMLPYSGLKSPLTKFGYQAGTLINPDTKGLYGIKNTPQELLGNVAGAVRGPLSVYGGGKVLGAGGKVADQVGRRTFLTALKPELIRNMKIGGVYSAVAGLDEGRDQSLLGQVGNAALQAPLGAATAGVASAAIGAGGYLTGAVKNRLTGVLKTRLHMTDKQANHALEEFVRDELGRWTGKKRVTLETPTPKGLTNNMLGSMREQKALPKGEPAHYKILREESARMGKEAKDKITFGKDPEAGFADFTEMMPGLKTEAELKGQVYKDIPLSTPPQRNVDEVINEAKKEIATQKDEPKRSVKQVFDELYTQWVDRYHPIVQLSGKAEQEGKKLGFEIRPEFNPKYALRRFSGMGGIADQRFQNKLKPIVDDIENLGIDRLDMDAYLKARRDINLGQRGILGSDEAVGRERVQALEQKYGAKISELAERLYEYQKEGFAELGQDFLGEEITNKTLETNLDYVPFQRQLDTELDDFIGMPTKKLQQGTNPVMKIKGSEKQIYSPIESIIANTFKQRAAIEKNRVAKSIVGLQRVIPDLTFNVSKESSPGTITVWENGQKSFYEVGEDIASAVKGMNEEQMNSFLKVLSAPSSLLRQAATGRNPEFMLPNIIRDQFDASINSKYGYTPVIDYIKGFAHIIREDDVYKQWIDSGGSQSFGNLSGRKSIQEMFSEKTAKRNLLGWLSKGLDVMGKYSEQPTRVGLFNNAMKKTGNETLSMYESREGTLDFSRMGSKMKVANSLIPFLNVGVQGFDKLARAAKESPGRFSLGLGLYAVTPSLLTTLYNVTQHPDEYKEIPQFVKDANFVFVSGRNANGAVDYVTIPKGNVVQIAANPVENFVSYLSSTNKASVAEMATQFLSSALPVIGDGQSPQEVAIKTIGSNLPQAIKPITENLLNKSFYKYDTEDENAKAIVPQYMESKPAVEQKYDFTPRTYETIGKVLNMSPLKVQNFMEGYFAGYTKIPTNVIESLFAVGNGEEVDKGKIPLLRRFVSQTYPDKGSSTSVSGGLDLRDETEKKEGDRSLFGKAEAAEDVPQMINRITQDDTIDALEKQEISQGISQITAQMKGISESSIPRSEKIAQLQRLDELKKQLQESDNVKKIDWLKAPLTGDPGIDKSIRAKQRGQITTERNNIIEQIVQGKITTDQGKEMLAKLVAQYSQIGSSGSGGTRKKVSITRARPVQVKSASFKRRKMPTIKFTGASSKTVSIKRTGATAKVKIIVPGQGISYKIVAPKLQGLRSGIKIV